MAFPAPNIGDILMLSHLAWKIGCAFTAGRHGAPKEFQEVEKELRGLTGAITMLAEALDDEDSIYSRSDERTQKGLATIIGCCSQSLDNLEAFVTQYQDIKRSNEGGGMSVQGSWRKVLLRNWKTIAWTTEGGGIQSLRNMLAMHTQSIQLAMQALQTGSLSRLENVIEPMAAKMDSMYNKLNGDVDVKLAEIHHVILSLKAGQSPTAYANPLEVQLSNASTATLQRPPSYHTPGHTPQTHPQAHPQEASPPKRYSRKHSNGIDTTPELSDSDVANSPPMQPGAFMSGSSRGTRSQRSSGQAPAHPFYELEPSPPDYDANGRKMSIQSQISCGVSPLSKPVQRTSSQLGHLSLKLPPPALEQNVFQYSDLSRRPSHPQNNGMITPDETAHMSRSSSFSNGRVTPMTPMTPVRRSSRTDSRAMSPNEQARRPQTPGGGLSTVADQNEDEELAVPRAQSLSDSVAIASTAPSRPSDVGDQMLATAEEQADFERRLLLNAAVLCEVTASSIDYTIPDEDKPGDFVMKNACGSCKVYLITRGVRIQSGKTRFQTSVWVLSDDRTTRLEVPLPEETSIVPYTVWNSPSKPIIRVPITARYHDTSLDGKPLTTADTEWVTFAFSSETVSRTFQNALMDKQVLLSVKTKRTMRIFDGLAGNFAFAEQLCGLENLRIVADPGTGVVSAMLHYSPSFADGYMIFSLNVASEAIRVKEEDEKVMRIKGLRIPVGERDKKTGGRRPSGGEGLVRDGSKKTKQEWVAGAKIEFSTVADKKVFMEKLREIQDLGSVRP